RERALHGDLVGGGHGSQRIGGARASGIRSGIRSSLPASVSASVSVRRRKIPLTADAVATGDPYRRGMDALAMILMLSVGPLVAALTILPNAKRINADWRAR